MMVDDLLTHILNSAEVMDSNGGFSLPVSSLTCSHHIIKSDSIQRWAVRKDGMSVCVMDSQYTCKHRQNKHQGSNF